jgi:cellulose synthase/poly-beta-1,6-N-acetylglucosamine synthase-like glycosyltransferase
MYRFHPLVQIIYAQSFTFVVSWCLTFLLGHRLRKGHWLLSLACLTLLEGGGYWFVARFQGPAPALAWWIPVALIALATVVLSEHWNVLGQASMASTFGLSLFFLVYVVQVLIHSRLGPLSLFFSLLLLLLQTMAVVLLLAGSYEILDVLCRIRWRRIADPRPAPEPLPRVSLHVPAYNEPPEMVKETLDALARLDYPDFEVIVIDDNTADERLWRPVEEHCRKLGFRFFHLENWPGFKSGALNYALARTDPAAEIVGVVDSDYVVLPDFLRRCVGFFRAPEVAFVQTPQDYRNVDPGDRYATACYDAYLYFFRISMPSRNEHNGIIFAGTMGLIRRKILEELGGWDEWCITEDAEISLRILDRGFEGIFVEESFGRGLMPLNFEGLKKQRFRWAFGGMQILRRHAGALLPWARWNNPDHRLTTLQQWDYLLGGLQWLNDPLTFAFTTLLLMGAAAFSFARSLFVQPLAPAVLFVPFLFIFVGISRFVWALRVRVGCGWRRALSAFAVLLGLTWVVTMACALGLVKKQGVFLRTPKKRSAAGPWHAMRIVTQEAALTGLCLAAAGALLWKAPGSSPVRVMTGLLLWQSLIYASAPLTSFWGHRSELRLLHPEYLASSRTTGQRFSSMIPDRLVARGVGGTALLLALLFWLSISLAPEEEKIFRTNPERLAFVPADLMETPPETQIKAVLYQEKEASLRGDAKRALELWDPGGVVRDANYTPADTADDTVWTGLSGVRRRYQEEFAKHLYLSLAHTDASVVIEGDRAVVVNDLHAVIQTASGVQQVYLSRGDRWTLKHGAHGWRITELIVNRAPR